MTRHRFGFREILPGQEPFAYQPDSKKKATTSRRTPKGLILERITVASQGAALDEVGVTRLFDSRFELAAE